MAALWIQISQSNQPPASVPSTLPQADEKAAPYLQLCPKCNHRLNPPFKATGRQVCAKCNWSDKPRNLLQEGGAIEAVDLKQLLDRATVESLDNMKPRKKPG
jgi:hypothetical protein